MNEGASVAGMPVASGKAVMAVVGLYSLSVAVLFHETLFSMATVWLRTDTYAHGFLILPISLYLAWRMRDRFKSLTVRPEPRALILVVGAGLAWLLAHMVDVAVVQHLAFVAVLVSGIWVIVGNAVARCYAFPLGFLFLAVPMGSGLIPPLMELTADTTEYLLRTSGIPVLREGMFLFLPTGTWSVVEECSGVNYVIASVTLGLCYVHLNYNSIGRQVAFLAAAVVVPVLANSARAYLVILAGHLSDMRFGTGNDHVVFGWLFFGFVMLLMFWVGSFWQQDDEPSATSTGPAASSQHLSVFSLAVITSLTLLFAAAGPALALAMNRSGAPIDALALTTPPAAGNWQTADGEGWRWRPSEQGADRELDRVYLTDATTGPAIVGLHLRQYLQQEQGAELVNTFDNPWLPDPGTWQFIGERNIRIDLDGTVRVTEARVSSARDDLLVWSWYRVDGRHTGNAYLVKILEARLQLLEGHRRGTRIFVATPLNGDRTRAREILQEFVTDHLDGIEASLDHGFTDAGAPGDLTDRAGAAE